MNTEVSKYVYPGMKKVAAVLYAYAAIVPKEIRTSIFAPLCATEMRALR